MRNAKQGLLTIVIVLLSAALLFVVGSRYAAANPRETEPIFAELPEEEMPTATPPAQKPEPENERPAPSGVTVGATLAVAGDMVIHAGLNAEAKTEGGYDFTPVFAGAKSCVQEADFAVSTLDTTFGGGPEYSGYPLFSSPDALAAGLHELGFDLINTAGSHCMDSGEDGLRRTLDVLENNGLMHAGTCRSAEERETGSVTLADVNGISIAFLSFCCDTNGVSTADCPYAVDLLCRDGQEIDYALLDARMAQARESGADVIAVFMQWGQEYRLTPTADQNALADHLFEQGADLILGGHTRVPQPMECRRVTDLNGREKTGFICYSLGNLVSCQVDLNTNLTAVVRIELEKDLGSGETYIRDVSYVPLYMMNLYDYDVTDAGWRYRLLDLHAAVESWENGSTDFLTESMYRSLCEGLETIHSVMGAEYDRYGAASDAEA